MQSGPGHWFDLDPEVKDVILTFPNYLISFDVDLMDIEDLNREQQFYLFLSEGKVYLVDTTGAPLTEIDGDWAVHSNTDDYANTFNEDDPLNWKVKKLRSNLNTFVKT